jgi:hypothetical protein
MTIEISSSLEYEINELAIVTTSGVFDVRNVFAEINIYDHVLHPCMSGSIAIIDAQSLNSKLRFDGSEFLLVDISKSKNDLRIKRSFIIYKQTDRKHKNATSESYVLHFISDEYIYSEQKVVNRAFPGSAYSDIVSKILIDDLKVPSTKQNGIFEKSLRVTDVVVPTLKPFEAILWCSRRALDKDMLPNFLFFENKLGFNFASMSTLYKQAPVFDVTFGIKNVDNSIKMEFFGARDYEMVTQYDYLDGISSGVYSGTLCGFDVLTRTYVEQQFTGDDIHKGAKLNKNKNLQRTKNREGKSNFEMYDSKKICFPVALNRGNSNYIRTLDPKLINLNDTPESFALQRRALLQNLFAQRMKLAIPGNFNLCSGFTLNIMKPKNSGYENDNMLDSSLYGKYLIVGTRHIIQHGKHETLIELARESSEGPAGENTIITEKVIAYGE